MMDKNTWITREQAKRLAGELFKLPDPAAFLEGIGISVEGDMTVSDYELSDNTIYLLAVGQGYYIAASVSKRDIAEKMPWLSARQCDDVAGMAAEYLGDSDLVGDTRSLTIEDAVRYWAEDDDTYAWNPDANPAAPFTDAEGKTWTREEFRVEPCDGWVVRIRCSDGRVFEECGSEWVEVKEEVPADANA